MIAPLMGHAAQTRHASALTGDAPSSRWLQPWRYGAYERTFGFGGRATFHLYSFSMIDCAQSYQTLAASPSGSRALRLDATSG